ncbi:SRP40, C-terminal domain-containing protein, partial [Cubamyces lactineus]
KPRKSNTPFQRVKPEQVKFADERLKDNRFESRGASASDYGAKAARDLIVTRGAGFRKEKNKKKRGSYRGGEITVGPLRYSKSGVESLTTLLDGELQYQVQRLVTSV